jgi:hypothetical protein
MQWGRILSAMMVDCMKSQSKYMQRLLLNVGVIDVGVKAFFGKCAMFLASPVKRGRLFT